MAYDHLDIVFRITPFEYRQLDDDGSVTLSLKLTCADKAVLHVLAYRADKDTHECWPSQGDIAKHACLSRWQVNQSIAKLSQMGVFSSVLEPGAEGNDRSSNLYTLNVDHLRYLADSQPAKKDRVRKNGKKYRRTEFNLSDHFETGTVKGSNSAAALETWCRHCGMHIEGEAAQQEHFFAKHWNMGTRIQKPTSENVISEDSPEEPTETSFTEGELSIDHCRKCDGGLLECSCPFTCPICSLALNGIAQTVAHIRSTHPENIINEESPTVDMEELYDELA